MTNVHDTNVSINICVDNLKQEYDILDVINLDDYITSSTKLHQRLHQNYKDAYLVDERIIITSSIEQYAVNNHGALLESIQTIINNIDISNYFVLFVTTNPNIADEYNIVLKNHSSDPVPFHIYKCIGKFNKIANMDMTGTLGTRNTLNQDNTINDYVADIMDNNNSFCIMPWVQTQVSTDGLVYPCCSYDSTQPMGNSKEQSLADIFNNPLARKLRVDMLANKHISGCETCRRNPLVRKNANVDYISSIKDTINTDVRGYTEYKHIAWDIRFDNLCNLKCRTCNERNSTSWFNDTVSLNQSKFGIQLLKPDGIFEQYMEHIDHVEQIYFAGGEPLIIEECWDVLRELIKRKRTDVKLVYNTNLSKLTFKKQHIFDYWKKFKEVHVGASLDAMHERASYWRSGTKWEIIEKNRKEMIDSGLNIGFCIDATVSLVNALHIVDFHREWVDKELITADQFNPSNILESPDVFCLRQAPPALKTQIYKKISKHIEWLSTMSNTEKTVNSYNAILKALETHAREFSYDRFWEKINEVDKLRNEKLLVVFPELQCLEDYKNDKR